MARKKGSKKKPVIENKKRSANETNNHTNDDAKSARVVEEPGSSSNLIQNDSSAIDLALTRNDATFSNTDYLRENRETSPEMPFNETSPEALEEMTTEASLKTENSKTETMEAYSPGKALRKAREHAGVSLHTIAEQTAIPINKLELLESDQFDEVGAQLFVVAYLKKYASLLKLPQDELIADFKAYRSAVDDQQSQQTEPQKIQSLKRSLVLGVNSSPSSFSRNSSYGAPNPQAFYTRYWFWLFLFCGGAIWAVYEFNLGPRATFGESSQELLMPPNLGDVSRGLGESSVSSSSSSIAVPGSGSAAPSEQKNIESVPSSQDENRLTVDDANSILTEDPNSQTADLSDVADLSNGLEPASGVSEASDLLDQDATADSQKLKTEAAVPEIATQIPNQQSIAQEAESKSLAAISPFDTEQVPPSTAASGTDRLDLDFNDDCWLEVVDNSNTVTIAKLMRRGDNLRLFGEAPFEVKVGNSRAVQIHLNGRLIDVPVNPNRRTARLRVQTPTDGL